MHVLLDLPTHALKLLNKSGNFLKNTLLFCQVVRIKRAHLGQNGIEFGAIVTGKFPLSLTPSTPPRRHPAAYP